MKFCETCFEKVKELDKHGDCKNCSTILEVRDGIKKGKVPLTGSVKIKDEEWIVVPSPFKAYPPSEGV